MTLDEIREQVGDSPWVWARSRWLDENGDECGVTVWSDPWGGITRIRYRVVRKDGEQ